MPSYKLTYFPIQGFAEPIRFLLSYGGVEFEDVRIEPEDWPKMKPSTPFGQLPLLEVDGKEIHQSIPIVRYLGKKFGIAGKNDLEALEIDAAASTVEEFRNKICNWFYEAVPAAKEAKYAPLFEEALPFYLERLDAQVKANGGYFVGGTLSWADLMFVALLGYINFLTSFDIIEKYENLNELRRKVLEVPNIKSWVEKRPKTDR